VYAVSADYFSVLSVKRYSHISLDELYRMLKASVKRVEVVRADPRKAVGLVLAEDLYAKFDRPEKDISHVDGFAVRSQDLLSTSTFYPTRLRLVKDVDPRNADKYSLKRGEAVFVETGYPIPENADAVIPVEAVRVEGGYIVVDKPVHKYYQVFPKGSDYVAGELVAKRGSRITPLLAKALLDLGFEEVLVYRRPRVVVYGVGDELRDEPYRPGMSFLPASSLYLDMEAMKYYGGEIVETGILPDSPEAIAGSVERALAKADLVITIGGVAMGPRDYSWLSLHERLKAEVWWRGVKVLPGRATSGFVVNGKVVVNQPGLPLSTLSSLILILTPLLNYMQGLELEPKYPCTEVVIENDISFTGFTDHYKIAFLRVEGRRARFIEARGSYYLKPALASNAFTLVDPGIERIRQESFVEACFYPPLHIY